MVQSELARVSDDPYCLPGTIIFHINLVESSFYAAINRVGTVRLRKSTHRDTRDKPGRAPTMVTIFTLQDKEVIGLSCFCAMPSVTTQFRETAGPNREREIIACLRILPFLDDPFYKECLKTNNTNITKVTGYDQ